MHPANERPRYIVTSSLIGWAHTQNDPWIIQAFHNKTYWTRQKILSNHLCIYHQQEVGSGGSAVIDIDHVWLLFGTDHVIVSLDINSSPPGQNGRHFADDIFKCMFVNEKFCILNRLSLKFVPKGLINNIPALVQIMAWCRSGDKPLSEPMLTHFTDAYMRH